MSKLTVQPYATRTTTALVANEVWQAEGGAVRVQTAAPSDASDGVVMSAGDAVQFPSGASVTAWLETPVGATIIRMTV